MRFGIISSITYIATYCLASDADSLDLFVERLAGTRMPRRNTSYAVNGGNEDDNARHAEDDVKRGALLANADNKYIRSSSSGKPAWLGTVGKPQ